MGQGQTNKPNVTAVKTEAPAKVESYVMKVTHLSWGLGERNHFYADKKPLINEKVMGNYANTLKSWIKAGWVEPGSYKK